MLVTFDALFKSGNLIGRFKVLNELQNVVKLGKWMTVSIDFNSLKTESTEEI